MDIMINKVTERRMRNMTIKKAIIPAAGLGTCNI